MSPSRPFEVEVCLNCEGVIAVWRRCAERCRPGGDLDRTCLVCGRAAIRPALGGPTSTVV